MTTNRRGFFLRAGRTGARLGVAAGAIVAARTWTGEERPPADRETRDLGILRPPGALTDDVRFLATCLRCTLCADACDTACIRFFPAEAGRNAGTPYVHAEEKACNLCLACTNACPSGALVPVADPAGVRMGTAVVDERLCVSHNGTGICGACHTACPLRNDAITQGIRNAPKVHADACVGCGLCEEVCIVRDRRAIRVQSKRLWS